MKYWDISAIVFLLQLIPDLWFFTSQPVADLALVLQQMRTSKTKEAVLGFLKLVTEMRVMRDGGEGKL